MLLTLQVATVGVAVMARGQRGQELVELLEENV